MAISTQTAAAAYRFVPRCDKVNLTLYAGSYYLIAVE
jgi:hypothetical protein